eukprot:jgi/Chrzof1/6532/Cz19g00040.t1
MAVPLLSSRNGPSNLADRIWTRSRAPPLAWDNGLAAVSQQHANLCSWRHSTPEERRNKGENMYWSWGYPEATAGLRATRSWVREWEDYDFKKNNGEPKRRGDLVGHFTQVVWMDTRKVGCAHKRCPSMKGVTGYKFVDYVVCQYDPPGNWADQYTRNVRPPSSAPASFTVSQKVFRNSDPKATLETAPAPESSPALTVAPTAAAAGNVSVASPTLAPATMRPSSKPNATATLKPLSTPVVGGIIRATTKPGIKSTSKPTIRPSSKPATPAATAKPATLAATAKPATQTQPPPTPAPPAQQAAAPAAVPEASDTQAPAYASYTNGFFPFFG